MGRPGELSAGQVYEVHLEPSAPLAPTLVGRTDRGAEVELVGAIPGEQVRALITHVTGSGRAFGRVVSVQRAAPERRDPLCVHHLRCGGCDYLHVAPEAERASKQRQLAEVVGLPVSEILESPRALGYRALAKLVVTEEGLLGSYRAHSHDVEDMRGCLIHAPGVERIIDRLRDALAEEPRPVDLRYVLVRGSFADGKAVVTLVVRALSSPVPARLLPLLRAMPEVVRVIATENDSEGDALLVGGQEELLLDRGFPVERVGPIEQWLDAGAFAQVNPGAAARLYERASLLAAPSGRAVLDLYSGSGGLGLTMAALGAHTVTGIERSPEAVEAATRAAERLGYQSRTRFIAAKVNPEAIASVKAEVVVLNPPRAGAGEAVMRALAAKAPYRMIYVSCNPMTLARDLSILREGAQVLEERLLGVDLFPRTRHIEALYAAEISPKA